MIHSYLTTPYPQLTIVQPSTGTVVSQNVDSNASLTIQANSNYPNLAVNWNITSSYSPRVAHDGVVRGPYTQTTTATSTSGTATSITLNSRGGSLSFTASATFPGGLTATASSQSAALVSGIQGGIPDTTITSELNRLYNLVPSQNKYVPNLMTGVAMKESSYAQYANFTLYGRSDLWPKESLHENGDIDASHIGLMQVPTIMGAPYAFNWKTNAYEGVMNRFSFGLDRSQQLLIQDQQYNPGLSLSSPQHEQNALCIYRLGENRNNRYWIPTTNYQSYVITSNTDCTMYVSQVLNNLR